MIITKLGRSKVYCFIFSISLSKLAWFAKACSKLATPTSVTCLLLLQPIAFVLLYNKVESLTALLHNQTLREMNLEKILLQLP